MEKLIKPSGIKELSVHMQMYMKYEGEQTKEQLEDNFREMIEKFAEENGMEFQLYDSELQVV